MPHRTRNGHNASLQKLLDDVRAAVRDGEQLLKAGATGVKQTAVAKARSADQFVRDKPYQTMGIIFGLGLIAGLLVSGMFSSAEEEEE